VNNDAQTAEAILLFDGLCNLCSAAVRFVIRHDRHRRFRFASLQSATARQILADHGCCDPSLSSMVLVTAGRCHERSRAALEIARRLNAPWPALYVFVVVPRPIRDWVYDFVGSRRYRWFGKRAECWLPDGELRGRFIE
jgi:predicted DCC family thiol-disulfide oxidoreductase YuxK